MATERTEPRIGLIVGLTLLAVCIFFGLRAYLVSYFYMIADDEIAAKAAGVPRARRLLAQTRQREQTTLNAGTTPLVAAVAAIGSGERPAVVAPRPSDDLSAMQGWGLMPRNYQMPALPVVAPAPAAPPAPPTAAAPAPAATHATPVPVPVGGAHRPTATP